MSTLACGQINVMMRLKFHFQTVKNLAQVTNYSLFSLFSFVIKFYYFKVSQKLVPVRLKLFRNTANCASTERAGKLHCRTCNKF